MCYDIFVAYEIFNMFLECSNLKFGPARIVALPALIIPLALDRFPNKLAPNEPNSMPRNSLFSFFVSILVVSEHALSINQHLQRA